MFDRPLEILKQKTGVAIMAVMLFFLVMVIMLGGLSIFSNRNLSNSTVTSKNAAAYYAAEAGINVESESFVEYITELVSNNISESNLIDSLNQYILENTNKTIVLENNSSDIVQSIISIQNLGVINNKNVFRLTSQGLVGTQIRTISKDISFVYVQGSDPNGNTFLIDKAVLVQNNINISNGIVIGNPVGTYSTTNGAVSMSGGSVPAVQIPQGTVKTNVVTVTGSNYDRFITGGGLNAITYLDSIFPFPTIVMPEYPNVNTLPRLPDFVDMTGPNSWDREIINVSSTAFNIGQSNQAWVANYTYIFPNSSQPQIYYVPQLNVGNNNFFTVDVGSNNITLIVDRLNITSAFQVRTTTGSLSIYVQGNSAVDRHRISDKLIIGMQNGNGYIGNIDAPEKFKVFVYTLVDRNNSPLTLTLSGSSSLYMSLMAENLNLSLSGSGKIDGYVVTGGTSITVSGGSSTAVALYYAPNALVSLTGGGSVSGAILADNFQMGGGASVTYNEVAFDRFPFSVFDPVSNSGGGETKIFQLDMGATSEHQ